MLPSEHGKARSVIVCGTSRSLSRTMISTLDTTQQALMKMFTSTKRWPVRLCEELLGLHA